MLAAIPTALLASAPRRRLKSKIVNPPKIPKPSDGVDDVAVRDRDEDRDDPEPDQAQQRPEQRARPRGEVSARGVPIGATGGHECRGRAGRLPERGRIVSRPARRTRPRW